MNPEDVALPPHRSVPIPGHGSTPTSNPGSRTREIDSIGPQTTLSAEYRQLMRWYPRRWRLANEEAMLGTLLDQAEHDGRDHPTDAESAAIARGGLAQRFGRPVRGERLRLVPLAAGALLSVFYAMFIIWSPATNYPGAFGAFANPSVITCALLVLAFAASLVVRGRAASLLALAAAVAELTIGGLAAAHPPAGPSPWEGPSLGTVVLFTGLAILGGASIRHGWTLTAGTLLVGAATAAVLVESFVGAALGYFAPVSIAIVAGIVVAVVAAIVILIRHGHREPGAADGHR